VADEPIHVQLVQSGGLAGLTLVAEVDVDELPSDAAVVVRRALDTVDLPALADRPPPAPAGPDRFSYELTVDAAGERRSVKLQEHEVPSELRPLLSTLRPLLGPRRRA
jgi:hypothetical protein